MKRPVVIALLALCGLSCGCRDRFDVPDTPADAPAANITIASLHAFLHAETVVVREELTVGGTVVSSDEAGNFYRTLVLDDGTGGAELRIAEYNLYTICPPGCRLTVSLRGCALGERNGVLQIGLPPDAYSPYPTGYISSRVLLERLLHPTGERQEPLATPCEIARLGTASCGRLVRIDALRFRPDAEQAVPQTWEGYRLFEDAAGRTIAVYTSAYARFADREIPAGECSLTGVLEYGTAGNSSSAPTAAATMPANRCPQAKERSAASSSISTAVTAFASPTTKSSSTDNKSGCNRQDRTPPFSPAAPISAPAPPPRLPSPLRSSSGGHGSYGRSAAPWPPDGRPV